MKEFKGLLMYGLVMITAHMVMVFVSDLNPVVLAMRDYFMFSLGGAYVGITVLRNKKNTEERVTLEDLALSSKSSNQD